MLRIPPLNGTTYNSPLALLAFSTLVVGSITLSTLQIIKFVKGRINNPSITNLKSTNNTKYLDNAKSTG